jgi:predicted restriction endonuclease
METNPTPTPAPTNDAMLDVSFASLFGGEQSNVPPTTSAPTPPETPQAQPLQNADPAPQPQIQPTQPDTSQTLPQAFELKTKTGTVYKSMDDAVTGIEHKDTLISQLRQFAIERTGIDPLTGQPLAPQMQQMQQPQTGLQQQQPQGAEGYLKNPQKYFQDLYSAYANNDPNAYFATQQKLIEEKMNDAYAPFVSVLMEQSKTNAISKVSNEINDFGKFYNSNAWKDTLQKFPSLANAIAVSESDIQYNQQLNDLYKMVYQLHQAAQLPELIRQQAQAAQPPQTVRPTTQPTSVTPPQTMTVPRNPNLVDANQRKAVIDAFESSGKADAVWRK